MNVPEILHAVELLRRYKAQKGYTSAQLATNMTSWGWTWTETFVDDLLEGRAKPSEEQREFIRRYLLTRYYSETLA